ncbi:putative metal-binding motif-containing protein [Candidatus Uhrbacteria bacterium]|nr:putative metal-binding motif-containing protein [Candidatus Uhrbacteria bacterium]
MNKFLCVFVIFVSVCGFGCTLGGVPGNTGWTCAPGEETNSADCAFDCPVGTSHTICADDGRTFRCALRPGVDRSVCEDLPPTPCGGDDRAGTACGCAGSGVWICDAASNTLMCVGEDAEEICGNGLDDDCDGLIDEGCMSSCTPVTEICDNVDNDCDGDRDEGCDDDNDDYCDSGMSVGTGGCGSCTRTPPGGAGNDCNDTDARINPGATEVCNGYDDNCNGLVDAAEPGVTCGPTCGRGRLLGDQICIEWTGSTTPMSTYGGSTITGPDAVIFGCGGERSVAAGSSDCVTLTEACQGWLATTASQGLFGDVNNIASFYRPSGGDLRGSNAGDVGIRVWYTRAGVRTDLPGNKSWVAYDPTGALVPGGAATHAGERIIRLMIPVREDCLVDGQRPPDRY